MYLDVDQFDANPIDQSELLEPNIFRKLRTSILITDYKGLLTLRSHMQSGPSDAISNCLSQTILMVGRNKLPSIREMIPSHVTRMVSPESGFTIFHDAILATANGRSYVDSKLQQRRHTDSDGCLTGRQIEVLKLISDGLTSKEIGERLGISQRTAEKHRANMKSSLSMNSTVELVLYGKRMNWIG